MTDTTLDAGSRMTSYIAFHGNPKIKADLLARIDAHYQADEITQGTYWENGKGCAIGCMTHSPNGGHDQFPTRWGIPAQIAYLADVIFEALPPVEAKEWPRQLIEAIHVGADLSLAWDRWAAWMLHDLVAAGLDPDGVVSRMAALFDRSVNGNTPEASEWAEAARDTRDTRDTQAARAAWTARGAWAAQAAQDAEALVGILAGSPMAVRQP